MTAAAIIASLIKFMVIRSIRLIIICFYNSVYYTVTYAEKSNQVM